MKCLPAAIAGLTILFAQSVFATSAGPSMQGTADSWHVSLHVSGGFAGVDRELELASTGALTARDRKRGTSATVQAPAQ